MNGFRFVQFSSVVFGLKKTTTTTHDLVWVWCEEWTKLHEFRKVPDSTALSGWMYYGWIYSGRRRLSSLTHTSSPYVKHNEFGILYLGSCQILLEKTYYKLRLHSLCWPMVMSAVVNQSCGIAAFLLFSQSPNIKILGTLRTHKPFCPNTCFVY